MDAHQRAEQAPVVLHLQVEQLMNDDEVLEARILFVEIESQRYRPGYRT
jgi:hypothetical protein